MAHQTTPKKGTNKISVGEELPSLNTKNKTNKPSTSADKMQESYNDSFESGSEQTDEDYQVGDIVWAKIGKYPFWPSIVCCDPDSKTYMKGSPSKFFIMY